MADNSPSLRAQPEDECAIIAIISKAMRYNYFISYHSNFSSTTTY